MTNVFLEKRDESLEHPLCIFVYLATGVNLSLAERVPYSLSSAYTDKTFSWFGAAPVFIIITVSPKWICPSLLSLSATGA